MAKNKTTSPYPVQLPQTPFPMKAGFLTKEPELIQFWNDKKIYQKMMQKQKNRPGFYLLDGPPYANGPLHTGHALNKILKDIVVKYKNMTGHFCPFTPVWDCHGLPIEMQALKKIKNPEQATPTQIRSLCRKEALHWVEVQKTGFQQLGVLADWQNPVLTMHSTYESKTLKALALIAEKNLLYRGKKPVHWCAKLKTAIASSEVEYRTHKSLSIYVKYPFPEGQKKWSLSKACSFVIWTTTPWTLPAGLAVCLKSSLTYGVFETQKEFLIVAQDLKSQVEKQTGLCLSLYKTFKGHEVKNLPTTNPLMNRQVPVIMGDHVSAKEGTGCVHTAPGHGMEDFTVGTRSGLKVLMPVNEKGVFTPEAGPPWQGQHIFKASPLIVKKLRDSHHLVAEEEIQHPYPYNPRSSFPLIFRATDQWFLAFDRPGYPVRKKALQAVEKDIQFLPAWGKKRLRAMLSSSPDWCLSRQRTWGVPLPVFYCKKCQTPLADAKIMSRVAAEMQTSGQGLEYWFLTPAEKLLPPNQTCPHCQATEFEKGKDIVDVWFDSGICHFVFEDQFPCADLYIEGSDQHRGWFQTSLNSAISLKGRTPFKALLTHCFVTDRKGQKMSKSRGNVLSLQNLLKEQGAQRVRLWVAGADYSQDIQISQEIFNRITETYRSFRNTFRFMLGNLYDFSPDRDLVPYQNLSRVDRWMLSRFHRLASQTKEHYEGYQFHSIYQSLNLFFKVDLSSLYLDILKDRLYTFHPKGGPRRGAQSGIYLLLHHLLRLMSPLTPFLSEEAYQHIPGEKKESVLLEDFPTPPPRWRDQDLESCFDEMLKVRHLAYTRMESMRQASLIGSSLEAQVEVTLTKEWFHKLKGLTSEFKELLVVSDLRLWEGESLKVEVQKARGSKCERCWHFSPHLNTQNLCPKCLKNLEAH